MSVITSRADWDATPWTSQPYTVKIEERTHFLVHYWGSGSPRNKSGAALAKEVEAVHLNNGWSGIGYNFVVGQDGGILEARGWNLVGAHCPTRNRDGIGVFVAVGGDDEPTDAAKASVVWLYDEAERRAGHSLILGTHGDWYATECAGDVLDPWVHAGMPLDGEAAALKPKPISKPKPKATFYQPSGVSMSVKEIQKAAGVTADGMYGAKTKVAVKALQSRLGVTADGLWGPKTEAAYKAPRQAPQRVLSEDGAFGPLTIKAFQSMLGVTVDGIAGKNTWTAAQKWAGAPQDGIRGPVTVRAIQRKVGASATGSWNHMTIRALQRYLNRKK